jgi:hypothetical protein
VNLPLSRRRELLANMLRTPKGPLPLSPQLRAPSGQILEAVHKLGLVGKRIDSIGDSLRFDAIGRRIYSRLLAGHRCGGLVL